MCSKFSCATMDVFSCEHGRSCMSKKINVSHLFYAKLLRYVSLAINENITFCIMWLHVFLLSVIIKCLLNIALPVKLWQTSERLIAYGKANFSYSLRRFTAFQIVRKSSYSNYYYLWQLIKKRQYRHAKLLVLSLFLFLNNFFFFTFNSSRAKNASLC